MTVKIKDKQYNAKYSVRALFVWESIAQRNFEQKTLIDQLLFFYSILLSNNDDMLSWDEFLDAIDEDPNIVPQFTKILMSHSQVEKLMDDGKE